MPFVYIVRCADGTLYTGYAVDVAERCAKHNEGKGAKYTARRRPVTLVYQEEHATLSDALRREAALKKLTRPEKEALFAGARSC